MTYPNVVQTVNKKNLKCAGGCDKTAVFCLRVVKNTGAHAGDISIHPLCLDHFKLNYDAFENSKYYTLLGYIEADT